MKRPQSWWIAVFSENLETACWPICEWNIPRKGSALEGSQRLVGGAAPGGSSLQCSVGMVVSKIVKKYGHLDPTNFDFLFELYYNTLHSL